jgi:hypothetical protein
MARLKLSEEERKRRHRVGMKRWHRRVDCQVDDLFTYFDEQSDHNSNPERSPDPAEFTHKHITTGTESTFR